LRLNALGRLAVNTPARAVVQRHWVAPKLSELGGELRGANVLEMGCGRGIGIEIALNQLGASHVDAFDIDQRMLDRAFRLFGGDPRVRLWLADARNIPVKSETYDAILDFGTLYLIRQWRGVLTEVARLLKPNGRFLFEVPACALTRLRDPLVTEEFQATKAPFGGVFLQGIESAGFTVRHSRLRFAGTIQLAGDLIGVATKVDNPLQHSSGSSISGAAESGRR
jgi:ubiquinone/menaquinone biosynthesis C-methylase UbiE